MSVFAYDRQMTIDMKSLVREGAKARLWQLETETNQLLQAFPDLRQGDRTPASLQDRTGPGRRQMTAAERRSVSVRMKKYWAARRKNGASASEPSQPKRAVKRKGISAAGRAAIAAAQKKRWAKLRREGKAKGKGGQDVRNG